MRYLDNCVLRTGVVRAEMSAGDTKLFKCIIVYLYINCLFYIIVYIYNLKPWKCKKLSKNNFKEGNHWGIRKTKKDKKG